MTKTALYFYLGSNGTITTPIHLPGVYSIKKYQLIADNNKVLTDGVQIRKSVLALESEVDLWKEIDAE